MPAAVHTSSEDKALNRFEARQKRCAGIETVAFRDGQSAPLPDPCPARAAIRNDRDKAPAVLELSQQRVGHGCDGTFDHDGVEGCFGGITGRQSALNDSNVVGSQRLKDTRRFLREDRFRFQSDDRLRQASEDR